MKEPFRTAIVINGFMHSPKFSEIYSWLEKAAKKAGFDASLYENTALVTDKACEHMAADFDLCIFWDKDIRLAARLEKAGLRLMNSSRAIEISDDKMLTYDTLKDFDVPMPKTVALPFTYENVGYSGSEFLRDIERVLGLPFVIKENKGSFGAQVYLAESHAQACEILKSLGGRPALAQEFIGECRGRDIRINMVGDECVAAMERYNATDFRANITNGGRMSRCVVSSEELELSRRVMRIAGLDFAGVDILRSDRGPLLCEVNSNAHFRNIFDCTGVNVADRIMEYARDHSLRT